MSTMLRLKKIGQQICYDWVSNSHGFILTREKAFCRKKYMYLLELQPHSFQTIAFVEFWNDRVSLWEL